MCGGLAEIQRRPILGRRRANLSHEGDKPETERFKDLSRGMVLDMDAWEDKEEEENG